MNRSAWPNWVIFETFLATNFLTKVVQIFLRLFGSLWNHSFVSKNYSPYYFGQLFNKLGYILFQHLVTLVNRPKWSLTFSRLLNFEKLAYDDERSGSTGLHLKPTPGRAMAIVQSFKPDKTHSNPVDIRKRTGALESFYFEGKKHIAWSIPSGIVMTKLANFYSYVWLVSSLQSRRDSNPPASRRKKEEMPVECDAHLNVLGLRRSDGLHVRTASQVNVTLSTSHCRLNAVDVTLSS